MRILLVEDDTMIGEVLRDTLRAEGYAVDWAHDGVSADTALATTHYDLLLLDLGLPRMGGLQLLRRVRRRQQKLPVLVATARDAVADRVSGLDAGADDYLVKPYDLDELLARVRALQRRGGSGVELGYDWGEVHLVAARHQATRGGRPVRLSAREWAVLEPLLARPGRVLSRQQLEDRLYGWGEEINSNAVEVHIHGIRRKLGSGLIENVRGLGYHVPVPDPARRTDEDAG